MLKINFRRKKRFTATILFAAHRNSFTYGNITQEEARSAAAAALAAEESAAAAAMTPIRTAPTERPK